MDTSLALTTERAFYMISISMPSPAATPSRFYRRHFSAVERLLLDRFAEDDGSSEMDLLRVVLARLLVVSQRRRAAGWTQQAAVLAVFCHTARNLGALTRCRIILARGRPDPFLESIAVTDLEDL